MVLMLMLGDIVLTSVPVSAEEKGHLFEKKEVPPITVKESTRKGSFLSQQLNTHGMKGDNPFTEYAKFDGRVGVLC